MNIAVTLNLFCPITSPFQALIPFPANPFASPRGRVYPSNVPSAVGLGIGSRPLAVKPGNTSEPRAYAREVRSVALRAAYLNPGPPRAGHEKNKAAAPRSGDSPLYAPSLRVTIY